MDYYIPTTCTPAIVYIVVSLILILCTSSISMYQYGPITGAYSSIIGSSSQLLSILCATIILSALCNINPVISWVLVIIWLCGHVSMIGGITTFFMTQIH